MVCAPISVSAVTDAEVGRRGDLCLHSHRRTESSAERHLRMSHMSHHNELRHERASCDRQRQEATGPDIPLPPWCRRLLTPHYHSDDILPR